MVTLSTKNHFSPNASDLPDWVGDSISIQEAVEELANGPQRLRLYASLDQFSPIAIDGRACLEHRGNHYGLDNYSIGKLGSLLGIGTYYPRRLNTATPYDTEALVYALNHAWSAGAGKELVFHLEDNRLIRGITSQNSLFVGNDWYLRLIQREMPTARLLQFDRSDGFTIYGNVLIPETLRSEADSDYCAAVSIANSEIGVTPLMQKPSLFRAICLNGLTYWKKARGGGITPSRLSGRNALDDLLTNHFLEQIEHSDAQLAPFLRTRELVTDISPKPLLAQVAKDFRFTPREASMVLKSWHVERPEGKEHTLFGIVNAVTRTAQELVTDRWAAFDAIGGQLAGYSQKKWDELVSRARSLGAETVDKAFSSAV